EADPLVLDPAAVPVRAAAAGPAARALSAQHGHPRGSEPARGRGAHRGRDRHHAGLRARAARRAGPDVRSPRAAHPAARARPERGAARRGVRGVAYYTGIVFELFDTGKSLRAVCGGGRYDGLLKALGGVDLPALGFGMGDVVLGELLKERRPADQASTKLDAFLIAVSGDDVAPLLKLAHQLRDRGVAV